MMTKRARTIAALCVLFLLGVGVIAATNQPFILQLFNGATPLGTFTNYGAISCSSGMNCSLSGSVFTITSTGGATSTQGHPLAGNSSSSAVTSSVYMDAAQFPVTTGGGAVDVCAEAVVAETAYMGSNGAAGNIIVPVPPKAYCSELPQVSGFHGHLYFMGLSGRARIYSAVSWVGFTSGIILEGTGPTGSALTSSGGNVTVVACNPNLHDATYPTQTSGAPCAAYFNSTTNMPQQTISGTTAASGGTATITLSAALSGTPPTEFRGRFLCVSRDQATNGHCWEIKSVSGNIYTVNSSTMVLCSTGCGTAFLDTSQVQLALGVNNGNAGYDVQIRNMTFDCAYVYACGNIVNGAMEEGTILYSLQLFNATVFGYRKFVGDNDSPNAYGGGSGGSDHSGPDEGIWVNYQSVTCENNTQAGCYGTDGTHTGAGNLETVGTAMACGNNQVLSASQSIISYSSTVAASSCQKNFAGVVSDGIAMGTNSNSIYGIKGTTVSLKDVFNTGTHVAMPEITNGIGILEVGPSNAFDGFHVEYATTCVEVGGNATQNETWIEDGSTLIQGAGFFSGDVNNCTNPAVGSPSGWVFDLGAAQGTSNIMKFSLVNVSTVSGTTMLQNNLLTGENCTNSSEKVSYYIFDQTAGNSPLIISDCSTAQAAVPNLPAPPSLTVFAYCNSTFPTTSGTNTYDIDPFQTAITSPVCTTLTTGTGINAKSPVTTVKGLCNMYVLGGANAGSNVQFTFNNVTASTTVVATVASGANNAGVTNQAMAITAGNSYNITATTNQASETFSNPRVTLFCW
jgi:hypothetical protein